MRLLLDTQAFLYAIAEPDLLSKRLRKRLLDPRVERWVSVVSIWEIAVKVQIGKLNLPLEDEYYKQHLGALGARVLPVGLNHSLALLELPTHHRDPFDRLLLAQAQVEQLTIATRDRAFASYDVETIW